MLLHLFLLKLLFQVNLKKNEVLSSLNLRNCQHSNYIFWQVQLQELFRIFFLRIPSSKVSHHYFHLFVDEQQELFIIAGHVPFFLDFLRSVLRKSLLWEHLQEFHQYLYSTVNDYFHGINQNYCVPFFEIYQNSLMNLLLSGCPHSDIKRNQQENIIVVCNSIEDAIHALLYWNCCCYSKGYTPECLCCYSC